MYLENYCAYEQMLLAMPTPYTAQLHAFCCFCYSRDARPLPQQVRGNNSPLFPDEPPPPPVRNVDIHVVVDPLSTAILCGDLPTHWSNSQLGILVLHA